jgi:hypothetical protein
MARTDQPHKLSFDDFVALVTDFSNPINEKHRGLNYSKAETRAAWNGSKSKIPIWCDVHGKFFTQLAANHRALGQGCPDCGKKTYQEKRRSKGFIDAFEKAHGQTYDYSEVEYINSKTPVRIICRKHGPFMQKPNSHLSGHGCPACWEDRRQGFARNRNEDYVANYAARAKEVHNNRYEILSTPKNAHDLVAFNCPDHGPFLQKAYSHLQGIGCPVCGKITSYQQREVAALIEGMGFSIIQDERLILGGLHIDIWVPEKRVGIEYNGNYWHTERRVGNKHREKYDRAKAAGIKLVQIFDFEWLERPQAVQNRLKAILGVSEAFAARKLTICQPTLSEAAAFFDQVHTQGAGAARGVAYALKRGDEIIACATFAKSRYGKSAEWELLRYASIGRVQGGFTRLFKAFVKDLAPSSVVSYADLRWGEGSVYGVAGFKLDGVTPPDYWYANKEKRISRYKAQQRPPGQSEKEWADACGYEKVLGVGHQRWIWEAPQTNSSQRL